MAMRYLIGIKSEIGTALYEVKNPKTLACGLVVVDSYRLLLSSSGLAGDGWQGAGAFDKPEFVIKLD